MAAIPRPVLVAASLAAGALLLLALAIYTPWARLLERIATVPWPGWLAATLGMSATYALRAGRLRAEWQWRLSGLGLGFRECLRVTLMHNAAVNLLPMRSGEASYAFLLHRRWGVGLGDAAASLLWLRLQDAMVLGVLGLAILLPLPLAARVALAAGAIAAAATLVPRLVARAHVQARWRRARASGTRGHGFWRFTARLAAAFRAARGGRPAWAYATANWVLKLGVVGVLLAALAGVPPAAGVAGALGGELAAVLPVQAPAGVGTYEAGVVLGAGTQAAAGPAGGPPKADDNRALIVGAALAVHALMVAVALLTALAFSLFVRADRAPLESTSP